MLSCRNLEQNWNGRQLVRESEVIDHARNDHRVRFRDRGQKSLGRSRHHGRMGPFREFGDGQVLQIPLPACQRPGKRACQAFGIRGPQEMDCSCDALTAWFVQPGLQRPEYRLTRSVNEPHHRW